jgi:hypothetical protein
VAILRLRGGERGQLLVIAAIGLAILLVIMTLVLNTAVFGEVYVSQTDDSLQEERGVMQYQESVHRGIGGVIPSINTQYSTYEKLEATLDSEIEQWLALATPAYVRESVTTNATLQSVTYETVIHQNESRNFTDQHEQSTWTVAENVSDVAAFTMNVSDEALVETDECAGGQDCFRLDVEGSDGDTWRLSVYTPNNHTGIAVTVDSSGGTDNCETTTNATTINITAGWFDETACAFTPFVDDTNVDAPYTLTYTNAGNVSGVYELTVAGKIVDETIEEDERYDTATAPAIDARIDGSDVAVQYRSVAVAFKNVIRIRPGESDA